MIKKELDTNAEVLFLGIHNTKELEDNEELFLQVKKAIKREAFKEEFLSVFETSITNSLYEKILVIHLGKEKEYTQEKLRRALSFALKYWKKNKYYKMTTNVLENKSAEYYLAAGESLVLSNYSFDKFLSEKNKEVKVIFKGDLKYKKQLELGILIGKEAKYVKDLVNDVSYNINPEFLEKEAKKIAKKYDYKIEIIKGKELEKKGLNLIYNVGKGSQYEPRLVILSSKNSKNNTAVIGKGVTYDTGGYNIKPTGAMEDMKLDMAGSATTLGLASFLGEQKIKGVIFSIPLVENCISSNAYKPGDILTAYNKKTVEVLNTDAEGRLVLADAIAYTEKNYDVKKTLTIATLTGAIITALGHKYTGVFSKSEEFSKELLNASKESHDLAWELPLEEFEDVMKGDLSDYKNIASKSSREAGSIQGAIFLNKFSKKEFAHLDIAGTSYSTSESFYNSKYATGRPFRLLCYYFLKK